MNGMAFCFLLVLFIAWASQGLPFLVLEMAARVIAVGYDGGAEKKGSMRFGGVAPHLE